MVQLRAVSRPPRLVLALAAAAGVVQAVGDAGAGEAQAPPPVELTAEQDHRRLMDLLGIEKIRPGANPRDPQAPNAVNYDESKANPWPSLPDPLVLKSGKKVTSAETWWSERRPEIVEDFDREIYGDVAFRQHAGGHTAGPNWPTFLRFADRYIGARGPAPSGGGVR